ncbi:MAG TPA: ribosome silencing factor [Polyangiaceae bacterium]|nr:ribosome silencing factor [Polyangiaceae bacterium]
MTSREKALFALDAALDKKALEPVLLDVSEQSSYTDFILILSGRSDRHVQHVADGIVEAFGERQRKPIGMEGEKDGRWVLIDYGEFIVHVFYHPLRDFYDLEGLWCDARRVELEVPAEARAGQVY